MGQPAARMGDSTAHGGTIVVGAPTVLIGGMPAARQGDNHVCPMLNPGTPPPPHVGGPIMKGSPTVLICGMPAARVGDICTCSGPPDSIIMGCPMVLIGEAGGGGGGGGSGGGSAAQGTAAEAKVEEGHFLDVKFVDKGGKPITGVQYSAKSPDNQVTNGTVTGQVKKTGIKQGNYEIALKTVVGAKWSMPKLTVGQKVKLRSDTVGFDNGTEAEFHIFQKEASSADKLYATLKTSVNNDKIEYEWEFQYKDDENDPAAGKQNLDKYSLPQFYFIADVQGVRARSGMLPVSDELNIVLKDENGNPIPNEEYVVYLSNGEIRKGKLDKNGEAIEKNIPIKKCRVEFPNMAGAKKLPQ